MVTYAKILQNNPPVQLNYRLNCSFWETEIIAKIIIKIFFITVNKSQFCVGVVALFDASILLTEMRNYSKLQLLQLYVTNRCTVCTNLSDVWLCLGLEFQGPGPRLHLHSNLFSVAVGRVGLILN